MSSDSPQINTGKQQPTDKQPDTNPGTQTSTDRSTQSNIDRGTQPSADRSTQPAPAVHFGSDPKIETLWSLKPKKLLRQLLLLAVGVLLLGQTTIVWLSIVSFEKELKPQLTQKAVVVGRSVTEKIRYAIAELGIPPRELVGVKPFFNNLLNSNTDIEYLILQQVPTLEVLIQSGLTDNALDLIKPRLPSTINEQGLITESADFSNISFQISDKETTFALLHVGISNEYVRNQFSEIFYDVITVTIISLLVTLQFLMFFTGVRIAEPVERLKLALKEGSEGLLANRLVVTIHDEIGALFTSFNRTLNDLTQRYEDLRFETNEVKSAQIDDTIAKKIQAKCDNVSDRYHFSDGIKIHLRSAIQIRLPLFLFIFSEELSRSFLPLFVNQHSPLDSYLSINLLISLPIALYMLAIALVVLLGGKLIDRFESRRVFLLGVTIGIIGYIGTFMTQGYYDLILWRILSGIGYGFIFIAAQRWITKNTVGKDNRTHYMTVVVGAVFVGAICGPAAGGIIASQIGFEATFLISALLALISAVIMYITLESKQQPNAKNSPSQQTSPGLDGWLALLGNPRFVAVTFLAAIPARIMLTGLLFYLVPLYLNDIGSSQPTIGRIMMLYGVVPIVLLALLAKMMDRYKNQIIMTTLGGMLSAIGCFFVLPASFLGGTANALIITVLALGLSHTLLSVSQLSIVRRVTYEQRTALGEPFIIGVYRLLERIGLILGPIIAGALASYLEYSTTIFLFGVFSLLCIMLYQIIMTLTSKEYIEGGLMSLIRPLQKTEPPIAKEPFN